MSGKIYRMSRTSRRNGTKAGRPCTTCKLRVRPWLAAKHAARHIK